MRKHLKLTWLVLALGAALTALPARRPADAAVPLFQAYQIGGWFVCGGGCSARYCCQIVPKPPLLPE